jgi:hypothetical protein
VTDRRARLGPMVFEELVIMGSAWRPELYDMAAWNEFQVEEVDGMFDFEEMLQDDDSLLAWENEMDIELIV